jgi:PAS domain S-box-containing protein
MSRVSQEMKNNLIQIEQAKQEWEATVDSLPELVCLLDKEQRIIRANRTVERWGLAQVADVKGKTLSQLLHANNTRPSSYLKILMNRAWDELKQGKSIEYEFEDRVLHRYLYIEFRPTITKANYPSTASFAAVIIHDITERKRTEKALQRANQELTKLNGMKDKFFSIVAHDLRGPFLPLIGNAELLSEIGSDLSSQQVQDMSTSIHRSARNVFDLLENLLQWSRMQMGRMECEPVRIDLNELVKRSVRLLSENASSKKIALQNEVVDQLFVYTDEHMLDTIIRNLVSNALKFTPEGGTVTIKDAISDDNDKQIEISIVDTGIGINEEDLAKLFKIDVHHTTLGTDNEQGTGLGLIMCKDMVEQNGGDIWVSSEVGKGTIFTFTVPVAT